ncbi:MAG: hypothetical protein FD136_316 [Chitinophagaceae bacterium]|nr:MAG: hypothetical protein FD136_316 [Chitinophagaceae bacterium]
MLRSHDLFEFNFVGEIKHMKETLFQNWNWMRALRLIIGLTIIIQAIMGKDWVLGFAGVFFSAMPILNLGCCGSGACYTPIRKESDSTKAIIYEEVD